MKPRVQELWTAIPAMALHNDAAGRDLRKESISRRRLSTLYSHGNHIIIGIPAIADVLIER
jgi:hypothetical protein